MPRPSCTPRSGDKIPLPPPFFLQRGEAFCASDGVLHDAQMLGDFSCGDPRFGIHGIGAQDKPQSRFKSSSVYKRVAASWGGHLMADRNGRFACFRLRIGCKLAPALGFHGSPFLPNLLQISEPDTHLGLHPCRSANSSSCRASRRLPPHSNCALAGRTKRNSQTTEMVWLHWSPVVSEDLVAASTEYTASTRMNA